MTLPEAAVAFPLRHPAVVSVVVGTRTPDQLASSSVERYEAEVPEALWVELAALGLVREPPASARAGSTSALMVARELLDAENVHRHPDARPIRVAADQFCEDRTVLGLGVLAPLRAR